MSLYIGVDPGLGGAISLICTERGLLECEDLPTCSNGAESGRVMRWLDAQAADAILQDWSDRYRWAYESVKGMIERPIPMPSLPASTIASQFDSFGAVRALLVRRLCRPNVGVVTPAEWKRQFRLGKDKDASRELCLTLYPNAPVTLKKHHDRAESILIARYGETMWH